MIIKVVCFLAVFDDIFTNTIMLILTMIIEYLSLSLLIKNLGTVRALWGPSSISAIAELVKPNGDALLIEYSVKMMSSNWKTLIRVQNECECAKLFGLNVFQPLLTTAATAIIDVRLISDI